MKIQMSDQIFLRKQIKNKFLKNSNPITIMIPTENINYKEIKIGLMPNLVHSMDGANIHLLIHYIKLLNIDLNLYTIRDCFAGDYLNMNLLENLVKKSFIDLYFKKDYLIQLDNNLKSQISSQTAIYKDNTNTAFIYLELKDYLDKKKWQ